MGTMDVLVRAKPCRRMTHSFAQAAWAPAIRMRTTQRTDREGESGSLTFAPGDSDTPGRKPSAPDQGPFRMVLPGRGPVPKAAGAPEKGNLPEPGLRPRGNQTYISGT